MTTVGESLRITVKVPSFGKEAGYPQGHVDVVRMATEKFFTLSLFSHLPRLLICIHDTHSVGNNEQFAVEVDPAMRDYIYAFGSFVLSQCRIAKFPFHLMPVFLVASPSFFDQSCTPSHNNVPLKSVYFGNFLNSGAMAEHWTIEFGKPPNVRDDVISAEFEYDRGFITIRFVYKEKKNNVEQPVAATIKTPLKAIRRIIVDPHCGGDDKRSERRIHFELSSPPALYSFVPTARKDIEELEAGIFSGRTFRATFLRRGTDPENNYAPMMKESAVADSPVLTLHFPSLGDSLLFGEIVSRLRTRSGIPIEMAGIALVKMTLGRCHYVYNAVGNNAEDNGDRQVEARYTRWENNKKEEVTREAYERRIAYAAPPNVRDEERWREEEEGDEDSERYINTKFPAGEFRLRFLLEALLSRGAKVRDQLLTSEKVWTKFIDFICMNFRKDPDFTEEAFEKFIVEKVDPMTDIRNLLRCLVEAFKERGEEKRLEALDLVARDEYSKDSDKFVKVRKIVITPTRVIYIPPERLMGNRILRKFNADETRMIRIAFRDDDANAMQPTQTTDKLITKALKPLEGGIVIGGRTFRYLGSSNSQMRDHGCYFIFDPEPAYEMVNGERIPRLSSVVTRVRKAMGDFEDLKTVPKLMARLGQCFTQSECAHKLEAVNSKFIPEIVGGRNRDDIYQFSDGVGQISEQFLKEIYVNMKIFPANPSCIQFRYRGFKGMLSAEPTIDLRNRLLERLRLVDTPCSSTGQPLSILHCQFRDSQCKFETSEEDKDLEVVKFSAPCAISLNKPFINILDQVSEGQSLDIHSRLCERIMRLLERQMVDMASTLVVEKAARDKLKELPRRYSIDCLARESGFMMSTEPFFRSLLKAAVRFMVRKQLNKEQINIPANLGRGMFGVVDETGRLQYGQVFIQYHVNHKDNKPLGMAAKVVHTGPVLITKNPSVVAGDVRMFEAVDIPELRHIVDVVVFPQHGPRSHPNEMAGSDLDGDEYTIIWDPEFFFLRNEAAFDFPESKTCSLILDKNDPVKTEEKIRGFFRTYLTQNSLGSIGSAHLINSDLHGIYSVVSDNLAYKYSQSVDFPKTGEAPTALTKEWEGNLPPEKARRKPDFMQNYRDPNYASTRMIGRIFREIRYLEDVIALSEERAAQDEIVIDELIDIEGWQEYSEVVKADMWDYNSKIKHELERYGISSEAELLSGYMLSVTNALSDREADELSFFNTNQVIESLVSDIIRGYRERFFQEFGGFKNVTEDASDMPHADENNVFHRKVIEACVSIPMKKKAVAMYRLCYALASEQRDSSPRLLSYAWIAFDVLAIVKSERVQADVSFIAGAEPSYAKLNDLISKLVIDRLRDFELFKRRVTTGVAPPSVDGGLPDSSPISLYFSHYDDIAEIAFFFSTWALREKAIGGRNTLTESDMVLLLLQFGLGHVGRLDDGGFHEIDPSSPLPTKAGLVNRGQLALSFLKFLASREFKTLRRLSFTSLGIERVYMRGQWLPLQMSGYKAFYDFALSFRLDAVDSPSSSALEREMTPFVVELPKTACELKIEAQIKKKTGATEVRLRRMRDGRDETRVNVCARGRIQCHGAIRDLLVIPVPVSDADNAKKICEEAPARVYQNVMRP